MRHPDQVLKNQWNSLPIGSYTIRIGSNAEYGAYVYKLSNVYGTATIWGYIPDEYPQMLKLDGNIWHDYKYVLNNNIQSGTASFDSIAGQTVSVPVTFPIAFHANPSVIITPVTSTPHKWSVAANTITPTGFVATIYHDNTYNGLAFCWIAVG